MTAYQYASPNQATTVANRNTEHRANPLMPVPMTGIHNPNHPKNVRRPGRFLEQGQHPQGKFSSLYLLGCDYDTKGDRPHRSNDPPGSASVHGWWIDNSEGDGSCPSLADVHLELEALWCIMYENGNSYCWFRHLN